ncbi:tyrosine-type recombinase/integrase [Brevibacterium zhoupengii]|uniref:tyrosine-type recombinase/integrase n=1 Tax=Brevibacterium zhoupengii TaxID=2898795 RepID=UPI001F08E7AA|nr:site-specific integrase [Brevibacterium zhoupengii]
MATKKKTTRAGFGSTDTLASGRVRARYRAPDGRRYTRTLPDMTAARAWLTAAEADIAYDRWEPPSKEQEDTEREAREAERRSITVAARAERWLAAKAETWKPSTLQAHTRRLRRHLLPYLGQEPLVTLTPADWETWFRRLRRRSSAGVPRTVYMTTSAMLHAAVTAGIIDSVPLSIPGAARHKSVTDPDGAGPRVLTGAEIQAVAGNVSERLTLAVFLAAVCGLRLGEISALRRNDLDLGAGVIHVRRAVTSIVGHGLVEHTPKSRAGRRRVAMPPSVQALAADHISRFAGRGAQGIVFPRPGSNGRKYEHQNSLRRALHAAGEAVGIADVGWHQLRHAALTRLARAGATTADLLAVAGHSDVAVAMTYQHSEVERGRDLLASVAAMD